MFILPEILSKIILYCELDQISKLDVSITNKIDRPYFLDVLKKTQLKSFFFFRIEPRIFSKWLKKRGIKFHTIVFGHDSITLTQIICHSFETLTDISLYSIVTPEVITVISNLCQNVKSLKVINNNNFDEDIFLYLNYNFVENLESLDLCFCSNYGLFLLQLYARKIKYFKIRNTSNLNDLLVHEFIKNFPDTYVELPLYWSLETNFLILKSRNFKCFEIISLHENDVFINNINMIENIFINTKSLILLQLFRITDMKKIIHLFYYIKNIYTINISSIGIQNLSLMVFFLKMCQTHALYITNITQNINIFLTKIITFFKSIIRENYVLLYLNFNIVFDDENMMEVLNFDKYIKLIKFINLVVKKKIIANITISGLIICTDFQFKPNWKNLLFEILN